MTSMEDLATLVRAAQAGDQDAFGRIVRRFQDMAFAFGYAVLRDAGRAQDVAQDAFIEAYATLRNLREPAAFPGWFRRVLVKHADRHVRRNRVRPIPIDDLLAIPSAASDPSEVAALSQVHTAVLEAVAALPPRERLVTTLFHLDGHSHREIERFLELPVSTIKKTLFTARRRLQGRLTMVHRDIDHARPSRTTAFTERVQFFVALQTGDLPRVEALLNKSPELLETRTEWHAAVEGYWAVGHTPVQWAAAVGDERLLALLIGRGGDVNSRTPSGMSPLHVSVLMRQTAATHRLLAAGADVHAGTKVGQTPLHLAAMRNHPDVIAALIERGAAPAVRDTHGRAAADWAALKAFPRVLSALGVTPNVRQPMLRSASGPVLETGVKIIDLFAPLRRGGRNGMLTPLPGVGRTVVLAEVVHAVAEQFGGRTVCAALEDLNLAWREMGVDDHVTTLRAEPDAGPREIERLARAAGEAAAELRRRGHEVLLVADARLALADRARKQLERSLPDCGERSDCAVTVLYHGDVSVGAEPEPLAGLDAAVAFSLERAQQGLWPAVDPLRSHARWLANGQTDDEGADVAARARRVLQRYRDLEAVVEKFGEDLGLRPEDRATASRARRLDRFLAQPFPVAEPWTGIPGYIVGRRDAIDGARAILAGECDDVPDDAFYFTGALADVRAKAGRV
jgi:F-type H+-transporting ATPase subunit beta